MIVDGHIHMFETVNSFTCGGRQRSVGLGKLMRDTGEIKRMFPPSFKDGSCTPELVLEYMDWAGVDKAVILNGPMWGFTNHYVADALHKWPDRFVGAAFVDPITRDAKQVLKYAVEEQGFRALKFELNEYSGLSGLHPNLQLDSPEWITMFEQARNYKIPVVFDLGRPRMIGYQIENLGKLVKSFPEVDIVVCHLGFPYPGIEEDEEIYSEWKKLIFLGKNENVWFDISSIYLPANEKGEDYPFPGTQEMLKGVYDTVGAKRMYWGSDLPQLTRLLTYPRMLRFVKDHCDFFSDEEKNDILGENAKRLYKL